MPEDEDSVIERREPSDELPIKDLESWLEDQADQLGTPTLVGRIKSHSRCGRPPQICLENLSIFPHTGDPVPGIP